MPLFATIYPSLSLSPPFLSSFTHMRMRLGDHSPICGHLVSGKPPSVSMTRCTRPAPCLTIPYHVCLLRWARQTIARSSCCTAMDSHVVCWPASADVARPFRILCCHFNQNHCFGFWFASPLDGDVAPMQPPLQQASCVLFSDLSPFLQLT